MRLLSVECRSSAHALPLNQIKSRWQLGPDEISKGRDAGHSKVHTELFSTKTNVTYIDIVVTEFTHCDSITSKVKQLIFID